MMLSSFAFYTTTPHHTPYLEVEGLNVTVAMPPPSSGLHLDLEGLSGICGSDTLHLKLT